MIKFIVSSNINKVSNDLLQRLTRRKRLFANVVEATGQDIEKTSKEKYFLRGVGKKAPPVAGILTSRTGRLRRSIHHTPARWEILNGANQVSSTVGTNVVYAATHELGDKSRNIPSRPFLAPAYKDNFEKFKRRIEQIIRENL